METSPILDFAKQPTQLLSKTLHNVNQRSGQHNPAGHDIFVLHRVRKSPSATKFVVTLPHPGKDVIIDPMVKTMCKFTHLFAELVLGWGRA
jgi:hypothetical protein